MRRILIAVSATAIVAAACSADPGDSGADSAADSPVQTGGGLETRGSITEAEVPPASDPPPATESPPATETPAAEPETPTTSVAEEPAPPSDLPDVTVIDLATGGEFSVASLVPSDTPILLWFWAPH